MDTTPVISAAEQQRQAEQQVQGDRAADHLGEVGGDRDHLGLHPERQPPGARSPLAGTAPGSDSPGDQAELGGQVLDQHGHGVRRTSTHTSR